MPCETPASLLNVGTWNAGRSPVAVSTNARLWAPAEKDCSDDAPEQLQTFFGEPLFTFGGLPLYEFSE